MNRYENVWCDTAVMSTENIVKLCNAGLTDHILWGSDYPIPKYHYPDADMKQYYSELVNALRTQVDEDSTILGASIRGVIIVENLKRS